MTRPQTSREYSAPWSRSLKILSAAVSAVLVIVFVEVVGAPGIPLWAQIVSAVVMVGVPLVCLLFTVCGYEIARGELLVRRLGWNTAIPLAGLRSAEVMPEGARSAFKVCGNGGLFAFCGWFWNRRLGRFRMCATDLTKSVVLRFRDHTWVVTPDRPEEFVHELAEYADLRGN